MKDVLTPKILNVAHPDISPRGYTGWEPHNYMILAVLVCIINPIVGPVAVFFSYLAHRSFSFGDIIYTYKWGNYALFVSMMAVVSSIIFFVCLGFALSPIGRQGGYYW